MAPEITPNALKIALEKKENLFLIDVREPLEYYSGHLEGSVLIPLQKLGEEMPASVGLDTHIITICAAGIRSQTAAIFLKNKGYTQVRSLKGGLLAYTKN